MFFWFLAFVRALILFNKIKQFTEYSVLSIINETYFYSMIKGDCLRVLSPKTEDGNRPRIGPDGRIVYKEEFLPLTAKRALDRQNNRLPNHLKKVIEVVTTSEVVTSQPIAEVPKKSKPGPKPKHAQTS